MCVSVLWIIYKWLIVNETLLWMCVSVLWIICIMSSANRDLVTMNRDFVRLKRDFRIQESSSEPKVRGLLLLCKPMLNFSLCYS